MNIDIDIDIDIAIYIVKYCSIFWCIAQQLFLKIVLNIAVFTALIFVYFSILFNLVC